MMDYKDGDKEILVTLLHQCLEGRVAKVEEGHEKCMRDIYWMDKEMNEVHLMFKNVLDLEKQAIHQLHMQVGNKNEGVTAVSKQTKYKSKSKPKLKSEYNTNTNNNVNTNGNSNNSKAVKQDSITSVIIHNTDNTNNNDNNCNNRYQNIFNNDIDFSKPQTQSKSVKHFKPKRQQKGYIKPTTTAINRNNPPTSMQTLLKLYNTNAFNPSTTQYAFVPSSNTTDNTAYETNEVLPINFNAVYRHPPPKPHKTLIKPPTTDVTVLLALRKRKVISTLSTNIANIICFLPVQDQYTYTKLTRQTMKAFFDMVTHQLQQRLLPLQRRIDKLLYVNSLSALKAPINAFVLSSSAFKALELLNQKAYYTAFHATRVVNEEVLLVYKVYFMLRNNNDAIVNGSDKDELWLKVREYFIWERKDLALGQFVQSEIRNMDYSDKNIYKVKLFCKPHVNVLNPLYYSKMCPTTGVFAFLVKEVLEYMGVVGGTERRKYRNIRYEMSLIEEKIEKIKEFVERLK